jgi:hypothetical protein
MSRRVLFLARVLLSGAAVLVLSGCGSSSQEKKGDLLETHQATPAQLEVLDRLRGTWDVTVRSHTPQPGIVTYTETYEWVLDRQFLRGETTVKSDGTQDMSMTTYDAATGGYRFWYFNSKGTNFDLPSGTWDAKAQAMEWKNGPTLPFSFTARWTFANDNTRRFTVRIKDMRGKVLWDLEGTAVRRK